MSFSHEVVTVTLKGISRLLCRIETAQLAQIPAHGPLILVFNHINFLDAPIIYTHLFPRPVTGFAKIETWDNPLMGALFTFYGGIPLRRGDADVEAMHRALRSLGEGQIVGVAPEGTRSGDGILRRGQPGVVTLALHSGAPLLPVAFFGNERFHHNVRRLRRTDFRIAVGRPFHLQTGGVRLTHALRQELADQVMYQVAALLPPEYRGEYCDLSNARQDHLEFGEVSGEAIKNTIEI